MISLVLLLPLVAAVPIESPSKNYVLDIEDGTLKNVQFSGDALTELDLSGMKIESLEINALDNLTGLKSLNLSKNTLEFLPEFVFSNLTNLEYLSLAQNQISSLKYLFVGLEKLRVLDISENPVAHLRRGDLFGLTKSARILADKNVFWSISTGAFTNAFLKDDEESKRQDELKSAENAQEEDGNEDEAPADILEETKSSKVLEKDQTVKLCMSDNVVISLEILQRNQETTDDCTKLSVVEVERKVSLSGLGIKGFQEGWYQLQNLPITVLDLSNNEIGELTKEILNDLPSDLAYVSLVGNRIRSIWKQVIENQYLKILNLKDNLIEEIEDGAFQKTSLRQLVLTGNQLKDLTFVATLPETLAQFLVVNNQITSIPDGAFSKLTRLVYLDFENNKIAQLQNNVFKGLDSLQVLILTRNSLNRIESGAFKDLKQLRTLYLYHNSLYELARGTFSELESLKDLNLAWNKFVKITKDTFSDLPKTLNFLHVDFNEIESLEADSFVNVPRFTLSLDGNKISSIDRGVFNLPTLRDLYLKNNTLTTIDGDSFEGLPRLKRLWLSENQISDIPAGACKNLGSLNIFDISKNPFERLRNGALYGLSSARGNFVYIYNNQLKELEAGVFDEV